MRVIYKFPMMKFSVYNNQCAKSEGAAMSLLGGGGDLEMQGVDLLQMIEMCPICCEEIREDDMIVYLPCNVRHVYHTLCIRLWLRKNSNCPLCKTEVI